jgi:hypothetical protein
MYAKHFFIFLSVKTNIYIKKTKHTKYIFFHLIFLLKKRNAKMAYAIYFYFFGRKVEEKQKCKLNLC